MKKYAIIALALMLSLCLAACGRRNEPTTASTARPSTAPTIMTTMPTVTNIPDPTVDSNSNTMTDNTIDSTGATDTTGAMTRGRKGMQ